MTATEGGGHANTIIGGEGPGPEPEGSCQYHSRGGGPAGCYTYSSVANMHLMYGQIIEQHSVSTRRLPVAPTLLRPSHVEVHTRAYECWMGWNQALEH